MCAPVAIGIATAVIGGIGAIGQYQAQQQAVAHQNSVARQQWMMQSQAQIAQNKLNLDQMSFQMASTNRGIELDNRRMVQQSLMRLTDVNYSNIRQSQQFYNNVVNSNFANLQQAHKYSSDLAAYQLSQDAFKLQQNFNDMNLGLKLQDAQAALEDAADQAAFEGEKLMGTALRSQGTVLASGKAGNSIGILEMDVLASYGRESAMLNNNLDNATQDYYTMATGAFIERQQQEAAAISQLVPMPLRPMSGPAPVAPIYSPMPEAPILTPLQTKLPPMGKTVWRDTPIAAPGPSGIGLVAGIGSSILGGVQAGMQANALIEKPGKG